MQQSTHCKCPGRAWRGTPARGCRTGFDGVAVRQVHVRLRARVLEMCIGTRPGFGRPSHSLSRDSLLPSRSRVTFPPRVLHGAELARSWPQHAPPCTCDPCFEAAQAAVRCTVQRMLLSMVTMLRKQWQSRHTCVFDGHHIHTSVTSNALQSPAAGNYGTQPTRC